MKWKQITAKIEEIEEAKTNANKMSDEEFGKLVANIKKSGLSSSITCYKKEEKFIIISGHHRYRACVQIGWFEIPIIYAEYEDLEEDEIIAIQLSHNSLHGTDDKLILKRMFDEIQSIDWKVASHVDINDFPKFDVNAVGVVPVSEHYSISLILYNNDINLLSELLGLIELKKKESDFVIIADGNDTEDKFLALIGEVKKKYGIASTSVAFSKILELAKGFKEKKE